MVRRLLPAMVGVGVLACAGAETPAQVPTSEAGPFSLVLEGGRVMDPETGLDAVRHVGIIDGRIAAISESPLPVAEGGERVPVDGLVVAPGFIDLHAHGQDEASSAFQVRDGVTTALELEVGVSSIDRWYAAREGRARVHYGASASHQAARQRALRSALATRNDGGTFTLGAASDETLYRAARPAEIERLVVDLEGELEAGGLGIGFGLSYTPGASHEELVRLSRVAAARDVPIFVHLRSAGAFRNGGAIAPFQEMLANAAATGVSVHIVHMNSSAGAAAEEALELIRGARARGLDVTTEAYPYTASASLIESALFDSWVDRPPDAYGVLQWVETGERLTKESFAQYRALGGWVITHGRSEALNAWIVAQPDVIAASDGIPFAQGRAHPRGAGTFARILGHYARDQQALDLMVALRKMTLLPARRLEGLVPAMTRKGRVQVGADADVTVFDADQIIDRATYEAPDRPSEGIAHVLVGGTFVVRDGALVEDARPGAPLRAGVAP